MFTALLIPVHTFYLFHHPVLDGFEGWMGHRIWMGINKEMPYARLYACDV